MDDMAGIQRALGQILATQQQILDRMKEDRAEVHAVRQRMTTMEKKVNYAAGGVIAIGTFITIGWNILVYKLKGYI